MPLQPQLPAMPKAFEPLMDWHCVRRDIARHMAYDDDDLQDALDEGRMEWVWNVAARGERRELRFLPACVEQYRRWLENPKWVVRRISLDTVMTSLVPRAVRELGGQAVRGPVLEMALNVSTETIIRLVNAGELQQFGDSQFRRGAGGAAIITISSLTDFLQTRRIGATANV